MKIFKTFEEFRENPSNITKRKDEIDQPHKEESEKPELSGSSSDEDGVITIKNWKTY